MNKENIFNLIVSNSCEVIPELAEHQFKLSDRLVDLGANSVDRAEIVAMTMEALALQFPRIELFKARNIGELVEVFYEKLQSA